MATHKIQFCKEPSRFHEDDDGDDDDDDDDADGDIGDDADVEDSILSFSNWHSSYQDNSSSNSNSVKFSDEVDEAHFSDFSETT